MKQSIGLFLFIFFVAHVGVRLQAQTVNGTCNNNNTPMNINDDFIEVALPPGPNNCTVNWQVGYQYVFPSNLSSGTDYALFDASTGTQITTGGGGQFYSQFGGGGSLVAPANFWIKRASGTGTAGGGNITITYQVYSNAPCVTLTVIDPGICSTPPPCTINLLSATPSACKQTDNSYDLTLTIETLSPPVGEQVVINLSSGESISVTPSSPTGGTQSVFIPNLNSSGSAITVNAHFATTTSCSASPLMYSAPAQCYFPLCSATSTTLGGKAFQDNNGDGKYQTGEPGAAQVSVKVYANSATPVCETTTNTAGEWQCTGLVAGTPYRIEFAQPNATYLEPAFSSTLANTTAIQFSTTNNCSINYGVIDPSQVCELNGLKMVTPCYVNGTSNNNEAVLVAFNYDGTGAKQVLSNASSMGTVWGVAYNRNNKTFYVSSVYRRHSGLGPLGTGGIYSVDYSNPVSPVVSNFLTVSNTGADVHSGLPLGGANNTPSYDAASFDAVGKTGLGDIDISADGLRMWVVNLNTQSVVEINTATATEVASYPIPTSACGISADARPWGLKVYRDTVYVGIVCSGQTGQITPTGSVYKLFGAPGAMTFSLFETIDLSYTKQSSFEHACYPTTTTWKPWTNVWPPSDCVNPFGTGEDYISHEQPIISDIEFDEEGSMILGILDRFGLQSGFLNYDLTSGSTQTYVGISGGDVIRICNVNGTFVQEGQAGCPLNNPYEYYTGDFYVAAGGSAGHQETSLGALSYVPGEDVLAVVSYDPIDAGSFNAGGIRWMSNSTGAWVRGFQVYDNTGASPGTFGKAAGLGDIEVNCSVAPVQIGNYVWNDENSNGIQDGGETGMPGVSVSLYTQAGQFVLSTTTNAQGNFYFSVAPNSAYRLVFGFDGNTNNSQYNTTNSEFTIGSTNYSLTLPNIGIGTTPEQNDSDAIAEPSANPLINNYPAILFTSGFAGKTAHRYDAGITENILLPCQTPTNIGITLTAQSCTGAVANNDGVIALSTIANADKFGVSTGATYSGSPNYAAATAIGTLPQDLQTGIPNTGGIYTIRLFNGADDCFTDQTVTLQPVACASCPTPNCGTAIIMKI